MHKKTLESLIIEGIPLSQSMAFEVIELEQDSIKVRGRQQENKNVHGTAFAGSLYCLCTLAVWGLVYSRLPENASLVMANGHIDYRKPVVGDIVAESAVPSDQIESFLNKLHKQGRAFLDGSANVYHGDNVAVQFTARLHARLN